MGSGVEEVELSVINLEEILKAMGFDDGCLPGKRCREGISGA